MMEHPDLEALSAHVDGEAPGWAAHLAGCGPCRARADGLRAVAAAVARPVGPGPAAAREAAIAAAVATVHPLPRRREWRWSAPALALAAAVVVGVLGLSALVALGGGRSSRETTTLAGPAPESAPKAEGGATGGATAGAAGGGAADTAAVPDLGDVGDAATLAARTRPPGSTGAANAAAPTTAFAARAAAPAPTAVGTRPCEEQARAREPGLREVVYFATARRGPVPAYVLGFATGPSPSPVTLLLLAQNGCGELLRAAGP